MTIEAYQLTLTLNPKQCAFDGHQSQREWWWWSLLVFVTVIAFGAMVVVAAVVSSYLEVVF